MANTRRKVKVIGTESYINQQTGEIQEMRVISVEERDANFHKFWLSSVIQSLDLIGNQKIKLAFWLMENMNSENEITLTQRQIAKESGISLDTVRRTIKALVDSDFLKRKNWGCYAVNPELVFKGQYGSRMNVLYKYSELDEDDDEKSEQE